MFNSILHLAVSHATSYQALLFVALASLQRNTGRERGGFTIEEVVTKMESMANSLGSRKYIPCPQYHMVIGMLCPLGEVRLQLQSHEYFQTSSHASFVFKPGWDIKVINSQRFTGGMWDQWSGDSCYFEHGCI
jgi:hypothetical protein